MKIWPPRYAFKIQVRQLVEVDVGRRGEMAWVVSHLKEGHGTWDHWEHDDLYIYMCIWIASPKFFELKPPPSTLS